MLVLDPHTCDFVPVSEHDEIEGSYDKITITIVPNYISHLFVVVGIVTRVQIILW